MNKFWIGLLAGIVTTAPAFYYFHTQLQATRALAAEHAEELTDGCNRSLAAAHGKETQSVSQAIAGDGSRTILIDLQHPYPVNIGSAHVAGTSVPSNVGVAWVIPRRIMPQVVDGLASARYGFVGPDGSFQGWYQPPSAH